MYMHAGTKPSNASENYFFFNKYVLPTNMFMHIHIAMMYFNFFTGGSISTRFRFFVFNQLAHPHYIFNHSFIYCVLETIQVKTSFAKCQNPRSVLGIFIGCSPIVVVSASSPPPPPPSALFRFNEIVLGILLVPPHRVMRLTESELWNNKLNSCISSAAPVKPVMSTSSRVSSLTFTLILHLSARASQKHFCRQVP